MQKLAGAGIQLHAGWVWARDLLVRISEVAAGVVVKLDYAAIVRWGGGKKVGATLLRSLHQINHALGRATIMDSVGSRDVLRELAAAGIDFAQGDAVAQPVPLRRRRTRAPGTTTEH